MNVDEPTQRDIETALLADDGACRDINFSEYIPTSAAIDVLEFLASSWTLAQAVTSSGTEILSDALGDELRRPSGSLSTTWDGGHNPEYIQAYFHWDNPDKVFCEITFFPRDFDSETFKLAEFLQMFDRLILAARSEEYYLRYENASWRHGQHGRSDVIFSRIPSLRAST